MSKDIVLIGGGGHSRVLIDLIKDSSGYVIVGILDPHLDAGSKISGLPVLGNDDLLTTLYSEGLKNACIAVASIRDNSTRKILYEKVKEIGFYVPPLIHPKTSVSESAELSEGVQVMAGVIVQAYSIIGENTIINSGAIVDHDCNIGNHVHLCPGTTICGNITVGDKSFIGSGTTVLQGVTIGKDCIAAAGAVIVRDVPDGVMVKGVPAK